MVVFRLSQKSGRSNCSSTDLVEQSDIPMNILDEKKSRARLGVQRRVSGWVEVQQLLEGTMSGCRSVVDGLVIV